MPGVDRPFSAVSNLPPWLNGPQVKAHAKQWGVSYEEAQKRLKMKAWPGRSFKRKKKKR